MKLRNLLTRSLLETALAIGTVTISVYANYDYAQKHPDEIKRINGEADSKRQYYPQNNLFSAVGDISSRVPLQYTLGLSMIAGCLFADALYKKKYK